MIVDLTYLREATDGNKELISQLVELFAEQVAEFSGEMTASLENRDSERMRKIAHKAKGSISSLGMNEARILLQKMEDSCTGNTNIENVQEMKEDVDVFVSYCKLALKELDVYLKE